MKRNDDDGPLQCKIEGNELVIRIGVDRFCYCLENDTGSPLEGCTISDKSGFVTDVISEMTKEDEMGQSPINEFLDRMADKAFQEGSIHIR